MRKKWTKYFAISGQVIGMLNGTIHNKYWTESIVDFAGLVGWGVPFAIFGAIIGLIIDYLLRLKPAIETHVKCPDCRELIFKDARKCKHCGCNLIPL